MVQGHEPQCESRHETRDAHEQYDDDKAARPQEWIISKVNVVVVVLFADQPGPQQRMRLLALADACHGHSSVRCPL
eukprot:349801-Chlamydomonas_euryale.AAC.40